MGALVTGGAGFIGSNLVDELIKQGHHVVCIDNKSSESNEQFYWNDAAQNWEVSINDSSGLSNICKSFKPEWIFHLAAESRIPPTIKRPQDACMTNVIGTCNVLQAARECGARVMYSSTSSAYGLTTVVPQHEELPPDCLNPYSVTKVSGESLCKMYSKLFDVETVIFRYFNVYGERQPTKGQYAPVVGLFLKQFANDKPMTVIGDGEQRRDYVCVKDIVNANITAARCTDERAIGEIFNIGTGINYSVNELANLIGGEYLYVNQRPGEARVTLADITKAKTILKWEPQNKLQDYIKEQLDDIT